jgi:hypothetical protein
MALMRQKFISKITEFHIQFFIMQLKIYISSKYRQHKKDQRNKHTGKHGRGQEAAKSLTSQEPKIS